MISPVELHRILAEWRVRLQRVKDIFEEPFRPFRFRVPRAADCLICDARPTPASTEDLDVALNQALSRLGDE